jgi:cyclic pyranopterin phosphate synthase
LKRKYEIYTDGSCIGNPGQGGWAGLIIDDQKIETEISGFDLNTTNNRMELLAVIKSIEKIEDGSAINLYSDSQYVINSITKNWKKEKNVDLWNELEKVLVNKSVQWFWVRGHSDNEFNNRVDRLARNTSKQIPKEDQDFFLTHLDNEGKIQMVDIDSKASTKREAMAEALVQFQPKTLEIVMEGGLKKGDVFTVAKIAGITGSKKTSDLIPLCHKINLSHVDINFDVDIKKSQVKIISSVKAEYKTGVEMEALTAVMCAGLTIYDMCKSIDKLITIKEVKLIRKSGGKSGDFVLE